MAAGGIALRRTYPRDRRPVRLLTAVLFGLGIGVGLWIARSAWGFDVPWGLDFTLYQERTASWLAGEGFYLPHQLAGPYAITMGDAMYPPIALWLFVPFQWLPAILWWAIPAGMIVAAYRRHGLAPYGLLVLAVLLCYPRTWVVVYLGNPSMWAMAAGMAGVAFGWPALAAVVKPVFAPLALTGVRHRSWWVGLAALALMAVPFGAMWLDYVAVLRNAQGSPGLEYVFGEWPIALGLLLAMRR